MEVFGEPGSSGHALPCPSRGWRCPRGPSLTHAVLHHHEAALVALEALALEAARGVHAGAVATQIGGDAALVDVWGQGQAVGQDRPPAPPEPALGCLHCTPDSLGRDQGQRDSPSLKRLQLRCSLGQG